MIKRAWSVSSVQAQGSKRAINCQSSCNNIPFVSWKLHAGVYLGRVSLTVMRKLTPMIVTIPLRNLPYQTKFPLLVRLCTSRFW